MSEQYIGIDYGNGMTNIDVETGIRFGVINQNEVLQAWADDSEADYGEPSCPDCGYSVRQMTERDDRVYECENPKCKAHLDDDEIYPEDAQAFTYDKDSYKCSQSGDDGDIFILKSPYYTLCQFCSPCAPGAGYIMETIENGIKAYCFGHDWFEDGIAPYPVYSVETGERIIAQE